MSDLWQRFRKYYCEAAGVGVDISRMAFPDDFFREMAAAVKRAFQEMRELERGAIANKDENRMVGHYWLRAPERAPDPEIRNQIEGTRRDLRNFVRDIHDGKITPERAPIFKNILLIGIGGSALGPQFVADALASPRDKMKPHFLDNTDPDGMDRTFAELGDALKETLTLVVSKSGGTPETRNGMTEAKAAYERLGLSFPAHAVAVTQEGSTLYKTAKGEQWLRTFPMWDWVGGRTSVTSAVGLLPALLQGIDADALLDGAREMDVATRSDDALRNPAALLALMWYHAGGGHGSKAMVVLPYKDRLQLFSRYLQQLVMESLGKKLDRDGRVVNQGLTVYGNKGSTDQHAYIQQLRDGLNDFFVTFIEVLKDRRDGSPPVAAIHPARGDAVSVTSGDYLSAFLQGTREALYDNERESITITLDEVNARNVGRLIALFERAVGFYASLINVNAYHQPGVEAGKKAANSVLELQAEALNFLKANSGRPLTANELAREIGRPEQTETLFKLLRHLAANAVIRSTPAPDPADTKFRAP